MRRTRLEVGKSKDAGLEDVLGSALLDSVEVQDLELCLERWRAGLSERWPKMVRFLAKDERFFVRQLVAESAGFLPMRHRPIELLETLVGDPVPIVRQAAARSLLSCLKRMRPMNRLRVLAEWTSAEQKGRRLAVARALADLEISLGEVSAIEVLARDRVADVRRAAAVAATRHLPSAAERCFPVLRDLVEDNRRSVRLAAIRGLEQAVEWGLVQRCPEALGACFRSVDPPTALRAARVLARTARLAPEATLAFMPWPERTQPILPEAWQAWLEELQEPGQELLPLLRRLKQHREPQVRLRAD